MIKLVKFQFFFPFCCSRSDDPRRLFRFAPFATRVTFALRATKVPAHVLPR